MTPLVQSRHHQPFTRIKLAKEWMRECVAREVELLKVGSHRIEIGGGLFHSIERFSYRHIAGWLNTFRGFNPRYRDLGSALAKLRPQAKRTVRRFAFGLCGIE